MRVEIGMYDCLRNNDIYYYGLTIYVDRMTYLLWQNVMYHLHAILLPPNHTQNHKVYKCIILTLMWLFRDWFCATEHMHSRQPVSNCYHFAYRQRIPYIEMVTWLLLARHYVVSWTLLSWAQILSCSHGNKNWEQPRNKSRRFSVTNLKLTRFIQVSLITGLKWTGLETQKR